MDRALLDYLPEILKPIREYRKITAAEEPELSALWERLEQALEDQFVPSASAYGVGRWEHMLQIVPKDTDSLQDRRFRVTARINEKLPYTWRRLLQSLDVLCGENGFEAAFDSANATLEVKVALTSKNNFDEVGRTLERMAPSHIVIDLSLLYNQHATLRRFTHAQLAARTHEQIRSEAFL